jgi:hypothetical protein
VPDGVLRLDTRTGQISQCSRSDAGWACKVVPDERSALETEIARLQGENATLKQELLARGIPVPGVSNPSGPKSGKPALKLPSDAEVDKVISFLERVWRRLIEMGQNVQKDVEKKIEKGLGCGWRRGAVSRVHQRDRHQLKLMSVLELCGQKPTDVTNDSRSFTTLGPIPAGGIAVQLILARRDGLRAQKIRVRQSQEF